ncbi:hypothetical protein HFN96_15635 [Rhizobium laguerreae]|nr:hypothetical protein [Rhizobium laguerreae]MBY3352172.1 hypothetical protein [Rhizobium laguerreae]MBY3451164.1 hypothetical protein [Rhizobium laguerreae]MBY3458332.1 hypothetical protein [Rhizobium laguerreae]
MPGLASGCSFASSGLSAGGSIITGVWNPPVMTAIGPSPESASAFAIAARMQASRASVSSAAISSAGVASRDSAQ